VLERIEPESGVQLRVRGSITPVDAESEQVPGSLLVRCPAGMDPSIRYGTLIRCDSVLIQPSPRRNPGGFDYEMLLAQRLADASLAVRELEDVEVVGVGGWAWRRGLDRFRARLFALFDRILEPPYSARRGAIVDGMQPVSRCRLRLES